MSSSSPALSASYLKSLIREVPDFPKKGILFYDITTLLKDKLGFARLIQRKILRSHHDVGISELAQLAELFGGEFGLGRAATADDRARHR